MKNLENLTQAQRSLIDSLVAEFIKQNDASNPYVMETDISLTFNELVKCNQTEYFDIKCYDGYAIGNNAFISVHLTYPKISELSEDEKNDCLNYRYGSESKYLNVHFGDVMMLKSNLKSFKIL